MLYKNWNDQFALICGGAILLLWATVFGLWAAGRITGEMPAAVAMVLGASVSELARILQYYFRRRPEEPNEALGRNS